MKRVSLLVLLSLTVPACIGLQRETSPPPSEVFHVAPNGNDRGAGSAVEPFATLERAARAVREKKREQGYPKGGMKVVLRGGHYFLDRPLVLGPEDSGSQETPVLYTVYPGEKAILSGGRPVKGWKKKKDNLWTVDLPKVKDGSWFFRQLFADGKRLRRARTPNLGFFTTNGPLPRGGALSGSPPECGFTFFPEDIEDWAQVREADIIVFNRLDCLWRTVRSIDFDKFEVRLNASNSRSAEHFAKRVRYRIENVPEALDEAGEWYLDRKTGRLSYLARMGEDPSTMRFVAPVLDKILEIKGDPEIGSFIEHVVFSGLSFRHTRSPMGPSPEADGFPRGDAPRLAGGSSWNVPDFGDFLVPPHCGQAVEFGDARNCVLKDCEIALTGNSALRILERCRDNRVEGCRIENIGGGGVLIGLTIAGNVTAKIPPSDAPSHNIVENNLITNCGRIHPTTPAVWIAQSSHNRVVHNEISDIGGAGVHLGWNWEDYDNYTDNNLVAYNDIHDVMRDLTNSAAIYTIGPLTDVVLLENHIHDVHRPHWATGQEVGGIRLGPNTRGLRLERNVVRGTDRDPFCLNRSTMEDQTWVDNDFDPYNSPVTLTDVVANAGLEPEYRQKLLPLK